MASPSPAAYPLAELVREAWARSFADRVPVVRAAALWVGASVLVEGLARFARDPAQGGMSLLDLLALAIGWLGLSAVTVWRIRALLAGAPLPRLMAPVDRFVIRYAVAELLLGALGLLPGFLAIALLGPHLGLPLAGLVGFAGAIALFARLHLVLVAAALGEPGLGFDRSWRATAGIWPRAALALLACAAPLALLGGQLGATIAAFGAPLLGSAVASTGAHAQAAVLGTFLAESRRRLAGPPLFA
ncbi:MAG: hypothetical protein N2038_00365 [Geminicoccaceae bacterium]|nr:hypothetical protein [Geminicoccaceae bacterium]MCX7628685.1 hypothetical protein [Geminicoccaceae bacterium]MDW8123789.1 hypothetical protein [Geminicoccaceae bacterium]